MFHLRIKNIKQNHSEVGSAVGFFAEDAVSHTVNSTAVSLMAMLLFHLRSKPRLQRLLRCNIVSIQSFRPWCRSQRHDPYRPSNAGCVFRRYIIFTTMTSLGNSRFGSNVAAGAIVSTWLTLSVSVVSPLLSLATRRGQQFWQKVCQSSKVLPAGGTCYSFWL